MWKGPFCEQIQMLQAICCSGPNQLQPMHENAQDLGLERVPQQQLAKATLGGTSCCHAVMGAAVSAMEIEARGTVCRVHSCGSHGTYF